MLEMAILETQNFQKFLGGMPPDPPRKLVPSALVGSPHPPLKVLGPPLVILFIYFQYFSL